MKILQSIREDDNIEDDLKQRNLLKQYTMNIVLVGAGGTGMSGVAQMLRDLGYTNLVAIDAHQSQLTDLLVQKGIIVHIGHGNYEVTKEDVVIYSAAVEQSVEVQHAKYLHQGYHTIPRVRNYFEFLGEVSKYFITIGCTGTNGKSSTTAMMLHTASHLLPKLGIGIVGALVPQLGNRNYIINDEHHTAIKNIFDFIFSGKKNQFDSSLIKQYLFIVESCEYKRHFLHLDCDYALITNMELDHTDYYQDASDYFLAFSQFLQRVKKKVRMLNTVRDGKTLHGLSALVPELRKHYADKIISLERHPVVFSTLIGGGYQQDNSSLVRATLYKVAQDTGNDISYQQIDDVLKLFSGVRRRTEYLGKNTNGACIYSDYGHHASSLEVVITALQEQYPTKKIRAVFQPHQISRITQGRDAFVYALRRVDSLRIFSIYAARESLDLLKSIGKDNIQTLQKLGSEFAKDCGGEYVDNYEDIFSYIDTAPSDVVVVVFTAGDMDGYLRKWMKL